MNFIKKAFLEFILDAQFPCMGAKVALNKNWLTHVVCRRFNSDAEDEYLLQQIYQFIDKWHKNKELMHSFAVSFHEPLVFSELEFEKLLWNRLQALHELDCKFFSWDHQASAQITSPNFSYSLGGNAFFVIGLHQNSSRKARRFTYPTLIFNLREQFQILLHAGSFEKMRDKIRARDLQFSGSINPMVADFGTLSEALQYSGRQTGSDYICPFIPQQKKRML